MRYPPKKRNPTDVKLKKAYRELTLQKEQLEYIQNQVENVRKAADLNEIPPTVWKTRKFGTSPIVRY